MNDVIPPAAFQRLCDYCFHQDALVLHPTIEAGLEAYIRGIDEEERQIIRAFMDKLLDGKHAPTELKRVLRRANTGVSPKRGEDALKLFQTIRRLLDEKL